MASRCDSCLYDRLECDVTGRCFREEDPGESTMICETAWDEAPTAVVFKGRPEWGRYVSERTCRAVRDECGGIRCSECEYPLSYDDDNYCPTCGAKVVIE